jgi:hypothetical protein
MDVNDSAIRNPARFAFLIVISSLGMLQREARIFF